MRRLILLRHGKTEPYSEGVPDETRALVERGHDDIRLIANALKSNGMAPTRVICSTARRARETWLDAAPALGAAPVTYLDELYLATPNEILLQIDAQPDTECLLVIGHNPGFHDLSLQLLSHGGYEDYSASILLAQKFPTGSAAVFTSSDDDVFSESVFKLTAFFSPKSLREPD